MRETIEFLEKQSPLTALKWSEGMSKAARSHVDEIGGKGLV